MLERGNKIYLVVGQMSLIFQVFLSGSVSCTLEGSQVIGYIYLIYSLFFHIANKINIYVLTAVLELRV